MTLYQHQDFDSLGRLLFESQRTIQSDPDHAAVVKKRFEHDAAGRITKVTLPDAYNPHASQTEAAEYLFKYDIFGNLTEITDPNDNITTFTYNELHNQTSRTINEQTETMEYDDLGRLIKHTDFNGQVTGLWYNQRGLLQFKRFYDSTADYPGSPAKVYEYRYDALGRKTKTYRNDVLVDHLVYDVEGRVVINSTPEGSIGYGYYGKTARKLLTRVPAVGDLQDPNDVAGVQLQYRYQYDVLGGLAAVRVDVFQGNIPDPNLYIAYEYDEVGSLKTVIYSNGRTAEYSYDELNQLVQLTHKLNGSQDIRYAYDLLPAGMRDKLHEYDATDTEVRLFDWAYDDLNRLTQEVYDDKTPANSDYTHNYLYELNSNRFSFNDGANTTYYFYNAANQLLKESYNTDGSSPLREYGYDNNGTLSQKTDHVNNLVLQYVNNIEGRLRELKLDESPIGTPVDQTISLYQYDADGQLVAVDDTVRLKQFLRDRFNPTGYSQILREAESGDISATDPNSFENEVTYIIGLDMVGESIAPDDPNLFFYIYDGLGSVRNLAWLNNQANNGQLVQGQAYQYQAYGQMFNDPVNPLSHLRFTGEYYDPYSQTQRHGLRWYRPDVGLWNRPDDFFGELQEPISLHRYLYANASPTNYVDPTGNFGIAQTLTAISLIAFGASTAFAPADPSEIYDPPDEMAQLGAVSFIVVPPLVVAGKIAAPWISKLIPLRGKPTVVIPTSSDSVTIPARQVGGATFINPGSLNAGEAVTFTGGRYTIAETTERIYLYRAWGGNAGPVSPYWSTLPPRGATAAQIDSALLPQWGNTAEFWTAIEVPPNTRIFVGEVASQGGIFVGGTPQVILDFVVPDSWIVAIGSL